MRSRKIVMLMTHDYPGGTYVWAQQLVLGLKDAGHRVVVIKSPRQKLSVSEDDVVARDAKGVLEEVHKASPDLVIFQSAFDLPKAVAQYPMWQEVLEKIKFRFTFAVHDHALSYSNEHGLRILQRAYNNNWFTGDVISVSHLPEKYIEDWGVARVKSVLPYTAHHQPEPRRVADDIQVGAFSHVAMIKQWALLFRAAVMYDENASNEGRADFNLYGGCATSPDVSATTRMAYYLRDHHGAQFPPHVLSRLDERHHKPELWTGNLPNGTGISYCGPFGRGDVHALMKEHDLFLNSTLRNGGSHSPIEYTTLEAIEAAVLPIVPAINTVGYEHFAVCSYPTTDHGKPLNTPSIMRGGHDDAARIIVDRIENYTWMPEALAINQMELRRHHTPRVVAEKLMTDLGYV